MRGAPRFDAHCPQPQARVLEFWQLEVTSVSPAGAEQEEPIPHAPPCSAPLLNSTQAWWTWGASSHLGAHWPHPLAFPVLGRPLPGMPVPQGAHSPRRNQQAGSGQQPSTHLEFGARLCGAKEPIKFLLLRLLGRNGVLSRDCTSRVEILCTPRPVLGPPGAEGAGMGRLDLGWGGAGGNRPGILQPPLKPSGHP